MIRRLAVVFALAVLVGTASCDGGVSDAGTSNSVGVRDTTFKVVVDYSQSLDEMLAAGKYDFIDQNITEKNFPIPKPSADRPAKADLNLELVHFNEFTFSGEAIIELKNRGLRPATLPELIAFGVAYKEKQREFNIVALGSVWQGWGGYWFVPCLWGDASRRDLYLLWLGGGWSNSSRFLVVRES